MNLIIINQNDKTLTEEESLDEVFESVDWRVLGLLLGISDSVLEQIHSSCSSTSECQKAMLKEWTITKQAYWSTLVDILKGPVLDEVELADSIAKAHFGSDFNNRSASEQTPSSADEDQIPINENEIESIHSTIEHQLNSTVGESGGQQPKGMIYVFGISGAAGTDVDVNNIHSTFKKEFHFTTLRRENLTPSQLVTHIKAAATFRYPVSCKYKAFYFAGHGGIDQNQQPYFNAVHDKGSEVISIQKNILTFFQGTHYKKTDSFVFLFDCCLSCADSHSSITEDRKPFAFEVPKRCLVAFATSPGQRSAGTSEKGGRWTSFLCEHLMKVKKAETLTAVLDRTHKSVIEDCEDSKESQPPQYFSCVGPIYLKGPPEQEHVKTQKSFNECRDELIKMLFSKDDVIISLASSFCKENIIDKNLKAVVRNSKGEEKATKLVDGLQQAITNKPEMFPKILEELDEEECLHNIVLKMKATTGTATGEENEQKVLLDLYKALNQSVQEAKVLEYENEKLKKEMTRIEEERKKREAELKEQLLGAQAVCSEAMTDAMTDAMAQLKQATLLSINH